MDNCGCTQGGCSCFFEEAEDGSITFTGSGSLSDPTLFTATNPGYIRPAARISANNVQNNPPQPLTASTIVTFNTEEFDTDNMIDIAGAPTRITIQTAGFYLVGGQTRFQASNTSAPLYVRIRKNGVMPYVSQDSMTERVISIPIYVYTQCFVSCIATDYFELFTSEDSGGVNHNIDFMHMWAIRMGDNI